MSPDGGELGRGTGTLYEGVRLKKDLPLEDLIRNLNNIAAKYPGRALRILHVDGETLLVGLSGSTPAGENFNVG